MTKTRRQRQQRGASTVEFAVIVALFLILLFGILEWGFVFLQEHYVANAAREGLRVGVRANNFETYNSATPGNCDSTTDRTHKVECAVLAYLDTLYSGPPEPEVLVTREVDDTVPRKTLVVTVTADNFFPPLLSALVGFAPKQEISYTAQGEYEDPSEN